MVRATTHLRGARRDSVKAIKAEQNLMDRCCLETGSTETFARSVNAAALAEPSSWSGSSPALAHHRRASRDGKGAAHPGKYTGPVAALRTTACYRRVSAKA